MKFLHQHPQYDEINNTMHQVEDHDHKTEAIRALLDVAACASIHANSPSDDALYNLEVALEWAKRSIDGAYGTTGYEWGATPYLSDPNHPSNRRND